METTLFTELTLTEQELLSGGCRGNGHGGPRNRKGDEGGNVVGRAVTQGNTIIVNLTFEQSNENTED